MKILLKFLLCIIWVEPLFGIPLEFVQDYINAKKIRNVLFVVENGSLGKKKGD